MGVKLVAVSHAAISFQNKHSDACNYLPPYKLDVLKVVEYKFSCEKSYFCQCQFVMSSHKRVK